MAFSETAGTSQSWWAFSPPVAEAGALAAPLLLSPQERRDSHGMPSWALPPFARTNSESGLTGDHLPASQDHVYSSSSWIRWKLSYHDGEGSGDPLQCSHLENPTDRGVWWATVRGATKSRTRLRDQHTPTIQRCALSKRNG